MLPILFDSAWVGLDGALAFKIPSYFVAIMVGFILASYLSYKDAIKIGIEKHAFIDFAIWMLIVGVLGARIMHVLADGFFMDYVHLCTDPFLGEGKALADVNACIANSECLAAQAQGRDIGSICNAQTGLCYPQRDCFRWLKFWSGGLTVYGAFIATTSFAWFYTKRKNLPWKKILDFAGYGIPLGLAIGRLGCLAAGCCFGEVCETSAISIQFPIASGAYQDHFDNHHELLTQQWQAGIRSSLPVWPTQAISSIYNFIIFGFAYFWMRKHKKYDGHLFLTTLVLYACSRFMIEFLRADPRGGLLGLATSQVVAILTILVAAYFMFILRKTDQDSNSI